MSTATLIKTTQTHAPAHDLASRYLDVAQMPWTPTQYRGIHIKVIYQDKVTGRRILIVAEDHRNLNAMLRPAPEGGWGLDGVWADVPA